MNLNDPKVPDFPKDREEKLGPPEIVLNLLRWTVYSLIMFLLLSIADFEDIKLTISFALIFGWFGALGNEISTKMNK